MFYFNRFSCYRECSYVYTGYALPQIFATIDGIFTGPPENILTENVRSGFLVVNRLTALAIIPVVSQDLNIFLVPRFAFYSDEDRPKIPPTLRLFAIKASGAQSQGKHR